MYKLVKKSLSLCIQNYTELRIKTVQKMNKNVSIQYACLLGELSCQTTEMEKEVGTAEAIDSNQQSFLTRSL